MFLLRTWRENRRIKELLSVYRNRIAGGASDAEARRYGFRVSDDTITRRFGSWRKALVRAHESITEESISENAPVPVSDAPRKRVSLSLRKRFFVLKRDYFACVRCGASGVGVRLEVHHRFPFAKGGSDHLSNLETLCYECNRGQRDSIA